jgi:hypothetical protein
MLFMVSRVNRFFHFRKGRRRWEEGNWDSDGGNPLSMLGRVSESGVHPDAERNGMEKGGLGD